MDRALPHSDKRAQVDPGPRVLARPLPHLATRPPGGMRENMPLARTPRSTHHLRKAQLPPVFPLDRELHDGRLLCWVPTVFPASGMAASAQEGLREYQQTREGTSVSSEGHARSGVQGESTVYGYDGATSVDLCPHPVTSEVGEQGTIYI